jgi:hypothetical protein
MLKGSAKSSIGGKNPSGGQIEELSSVDNRKNSLIF